MKNPIAPQIVPIFSLILDFFGDGFEDSNWEPHFGQNNLASVSLPQDEQKTMKFLL